MARLQAQDSLTFWKCPALPFVELRRAQDSAACFQTHSHDEFSFGCLDGQADYRNMGRHEVIHNDILVTINPGEAHSCNPIGGEWSYRMLFIDTEWIASWQQETFHTDGWDYLGFENRQCRDQRPMRQFHRLFEGLAGEEDPLAAESLLIEGLEDGIAPLISKNWREKTEGSLPVGALKQARDLLLDRLEDNVSLEELCGVAGLSRSYLLRSFKRHYGQSPHGYQLDHRIKQGKNWLAHGRTILDTALDLGFSDQAHFQRAFKKRLAVTPGQYQAFFQ